MTDVVIVGAGAAGLATAIFTRRLAPALSVHLLDGAARPGAKILVSGGGRCNVTNRTVSERDFNGGKPTLIRRVLRSLPVPDTMAFFSALGVSLHEENDGKLFPDSNRARDVLDALLREVHAAGARLVPATRVQHVEPAGDGFVLQTSRGEMRARAVVLATGGQALPKSGSDGAGFEIARRLGHTIVATTPALVPLLLAAEETALHRRLMGVSHPATLALWVNGAVSARFAGPLLWTHLGVSGPAVLDASRHWLRARMEGAETRLTASFYPRGLFDDVDRLWTRAAGERPKATAGTQLSDALPGSVAAALLERLEIDASTPLARLSRNTRRRLAQGLTEWPLDVTGSRGYTHAEATAGGVALDEIDPATMGSRRCAGLYLVGEVLDVDGRLGGFNFQWAWASARTAASGLAG